MVIYSFDEYLLSTYNVTGTVEGAGDAVVHRTDSVLTLGELVFQGWRDKQ